MTPLISIIIPTFNRLNEIKRAIDSITLQTFKNWEIIVVISFQSSLDLGASFSPSTSIKVGSLWVPDKAVYLLMAMAWSIFSK